MKIIYALDYISLLFISLFNTRLSNFYVYYSLNRVGDAIWITRVKDTRCTERKRK